MKKKLIGILVCTLLIASISNVMLVIGQPPLDHDVGVVSIGSPTEDGPAREFPVDVTIKNYGQFPEGNFKTYVQISEIDSENSDKLLTEEFIGVTPPALPPGWTATHSNWGTSNSANAGGTYQEARFTSYPPSYPDEFRFYTPPMNTVDHGAVEIEFKHKNTYSYGTYTLNIGTSPDGETWDTVWSTTGAVGPETVTVLTGENVGTDEFHVSWTVKTESYSILYWYIDDIVIDAYEPEYEQEVEIAIGPGEEIELTTFPDWKPEFLLEKISGTKTYLIKSWTNLEVPPDQNPLNDCKTEILTLDYWHDVGVDSIKTCRIIGTHPVYAIFQNLGTFPELGLTATAEIKKGGVTVYGPVSISNIALDEPLGGTKTVDLGNCAFTQVGTYEIIVRISLNVDDYPSNNCLTDSVEIVDIGVLIGDLIAMVESMSLFPPGAEGEMTAKLDNAKRAFDRGDVAGAIDFLNEFKGRVDFWKGQAICTLTDEQAAELKAAADSIIAILENC